MKYQIGRSQNLSKTNHQNSLTTIKIRDTLDNDEMCCKCGKELDLPNEIGYATRKIRYYRKEYQVYYCADCLIFKRFP